ncbi:MAG TPA: cbb3-type cytochrome oxidase assembly protein CcoS [Candidatus Sulfotelmatobacter sp.]|nr:cbb3-type cytochrome oxidase assembly protein CcoS [Candidatus Sulfotelmatobacter sp.]
MKAILMLIPVALALGTIGLVAFLWSLRSGQFEDLDGAANRILFDYDDAIKPPVAAPVAETGAVEAVDKESPEPKP